MLNKLKRKVYISPNPFDKEKIYNPYVSNLFESFENRDDVKLLYGRGFRQLGFLNFVFYIFSDVVILSWPENLSHAKFRIFYIPYFVCCILLMKLFKKRIVWILHNRHPHAGSNRYSRFLMKFMARMCTLCITHSKEGVGYFLKSLYNKPKCFYIPHPVYTTQILSSEDEQWDYIIWGEIQKRKGILEFLKYIVKDTFFNDKKILLCGKCVDKEYNDEILKILPSNVTYINRFLDDKELDTYLRSSKRILFTYNSSSILCSGALVFSLNYCKQIIGPNEGVFAEMQDIVSCFSSFDEIRKMGYKDNSTAIEQYITNNAWHQFPEKVFEKLYDK